MQDTKTRLTSTMKSKDKARDGREQRFGHVNATNLNPYLNNIFGKLVEKPIKKTKIQTSEDLGF